MVGESVRIDLVEGVDDGGIELFPAEPVDLCGGFVEGPGVFVGAGVGEGIEDVCDCDDASGERDLFCFEAVWVTLAVPPFVVAQRDPFGELEDVGVAVREDAGAVAGVLGHLCELDGCEEARLEQDVVGDAELADVV